MNPQWHDEFVALCALFPSGELTEEEWALLQVHLAYCDSCRLAFEEYEQIAFEAIPALAAASVSESAYGAANSPFSIEAAESSLMSRLGSKTHTPETEPVHRISWPVAGGLLAASFALITGLFAVHIYRPPVPQATQTASLQPAAASAKSDARSQAETDLRSQLEASQTKESELEKKLNAEEDHSRQLTLTESGVEQQLEAAKTERKTLSDERDSLNDQLRTAQLEAQSWKDKSSAAAAAASQQSARLIALETKLRDVNTSLDEKDRMLALDKELLDHDREIRDLIAARDLYIADIYDVEQNGKASKSFGRIFYTKDKSLVFYGYDLDKQPGLKQSVAFQAWGNGEDKQNVSLGLFYQDETHKRWVLRFNDVKTLARLNMVFVTAEPQGGSAKPTGKPLLQAYLQVKPNHP